jgi:hypothetical protein
MKRINVNTYEVEGGEEVTVEIVAIQVGDSSAFTLDATERDAEAGLSPKTYKFTVSVGPRLAHFGNVSCLFPKSAPDQAAFHVFLTGDRGGGRFIGPVIKKTHASRDRDLEFRRA